jgi:hypothetical protein
MEWELTAEEWVDEHPHDEFNYVLEGTLLVTCDGETVEVPQGSIVRVPAGSTGRYWAPDHARMLAIYGPNPDGAPSIISGCDPSTHPLRACLLDHGLWRSGFARSQMRMSAICTVAR